MEPKRSICVKDVILECDPAALQQTAAERIHPASGPRRAELDAAVQALVQRISMTEPACGPAPLAVSYPARYGGEWMIRTALFDPETLQNRLTPIPAWDALEDCLFPGEDLSAFGTVPVAPAELPGLIALETELPPPLEWARPELGTILSARVMDPDLDPITRRELAGDLLARYLSGTFAPVSGQPGPEETLYNRLSLYHALWAAHDTLSGGEPA